MTNDYDYDRYTIRNEVSSSVEMVIVIVISHSSRVWQSRSLAVSCLCKLNLLIYLSNFLMQKYNYFPENRLRNILTFAKPTPAQGAWQIFLCHLCKFFAPDNEKICIFAPSMKSILMHSKSNTFLTGKVPWGRQILSRR